MSILLGSSPATPSAAPAPPSTTLNDGVISHWTMNEESGVRSDSEGSHDATAFNSPGFVAGVNGNAVDFDATGPKYLSVPFHAAFNRGSLDFSWLCGVQFKTFANDVYPIWIWGAGTSNQKMLLRYKKTANRININIRDTAAGAVSLNADNFGAPSLSTWYMIYLEYIASSKTLGISVNNGTKDTVVLSNHINDPPAEPVLFGKSMNGYMDFCGNWNRILTPSELTEAYNAGAWKPGYPYV